MHSSRECRGSPASAEMAMQILVNVELEWVKQKMGVILDLDGQKAHQICSFKEFPLQAIAIPLQATGSEDRKPQHLVALFTRTRVRVAQVKLVT